MKRKTKKSPHRYFLVGTQQKIIVFKHGKDGVGRSVFSDGEFGDAWWSLHEMQHLGAVEIPAKLLKKVARL